LGRNEGTILASEEVKAKQEATTPMQKGSMYPELQQMRMHNPLEKYEHRN